MNLIQTKVSVTATFLSHSSFGSCISSEMLPPTLRSMWCRVLFIKLASLAARWSIHIIILQRSSPTEIKVYTFTDKCYILNCSLGLVNQSVNQNVFLHSEWLVNKFMNTQIRRAFHWHCVLFTYLHLLTVCTFKMPCFKARLEQVY